MIIMKIETLKINVPFNYLWLKEVTDVDLSVHCAKSLLGDYIKQVTNKNSEYHQLECSDNIHYLCGVARPWNWDNNFHLAFEPCEGNYLTVDKKGIYVEIKDAIELPISQSNVDFNHPKAKFKTYYTCRNWQFAHWFNQHRKS